MYVVLLSIVFVCKINYLHLHHQNKTTVQWQHRNTTRARSWKTHGDYSDFTENSLGLLASAFL